MYIHRFGRVIASIIPFIIFYSANAQYVSWSRYYGGTENDYACSVIPMEDGGFAVFGYTFSFGAGSYDYYFVMTDSMGNLEWSETYGTGASDIAQSLDCTSDGGFILAGSRNHYPGDSDMYVVKTDSQGVLEWETLYGSAGYNDYCSSAKQVSDGGYILAGYTNSFSGGSNKDFTLIKTDELGNIQWQTVYGGTRTDECYDVEIAQDGGYLMSGITYPEGTGSPKYYAIKTDSNGNLQWEVTLGGDEFDKCLDAVHVADGGFVLAGYSDSFDGAYFDFYVVKLDSTGAIEWERIVDHEGQDDHARYICETSDNGLIVCGETSPPGDHPQGYVVKLDSEGNLLWELTFGGSDNEYLHCIEESAEEEYISAGITGSYGPAMYNFWLVKIESDVAISIESQGSLENEGNLLTVFPNPAHGLFEVNYSLEHQSDVSITIYGTDGRLMCNYDLGSQGQGAHSVVLNTYGSMGEKLPQGLYFVNLKTDESRSVRRVLILD